MLARLLLVAKLAALVAVSFFCVAFGLTLLTVRSEVRGTAQQINTAVARITATTEQVGATVTTDVDRLTTHANRLMIATGATARQAHLAARYQRQFWETQSPALARQAGRLLDTGNRVLESGNTVLLGVNDTNTHLQGNLDAMTAAVVGTATEGQATFRTFRGFASDPDFMTTKHNLARITSGTAQLSEDAAYKFHRFAHPEDLKGKDKVWRYTIGGLRVVGDLFRVIYFWP